MPQQVKRLIVVFVLLIGALVGARLFLVPETFGELGHYRAAAIDSVTTLPIHYAGEQVCLDCHDDIGEEKQVARHAGLSCETCHGPALEHADDPDSGLPHVPRQRQECTLCHSYNPSRPTGFPQIDPLTHNPVKACISCHDPHNPEPPETPAGCGACHGEIARTKAVSHHAQLECVRCHETPEEHKVQPRHYRPGKPRDRTLCGQCHDRNSDAPREIPRISIATHEPGYVCWQCHYPHYPEAK